MSCIEAIFMSLIVMSFIVISFIFGKDCVLSKDIVSATDYVL